MACVAVDFVSLAAPKGRGRIGFKPTETVLVAIAARGLGRWTHKRVFAEHERQIAADLMKKVEAAGVINPQHWVKV